MKNNDDSLLKEKINNLDNVPPGLSWDKEASWERIKINQKAIARKTGFLKRTVWGVMLAVFVAGAFLFYSSEKSEVVSEVKKKAYTASVKKKYETPLQEQSTAVNSKPNSKKKNMTPGKTAALLPASTDTSSIILLVPIDTVKVSSYKAKESDTIKIPKAAERYPSLIGNSLEEDFRLDTLEKDFILDIQEKNKALKDRNDKKKERLQTGRKARVKLKKSYPSITD
jgi:hypothetical protein